MITPIIRKLSLLLQYHLHRLLPRFFRMPQTLVHSFRVIEERHVVSTDYSVEGDSIEELENALREMRDKGIVIRHSPIEPMQEEFSFGYPLNTSAYSCRFTAYPEISPVYYPLFKFITIESQEIQGEIVAHKAALVDWSPDHDC